MTANTGVQMLELADEMKRELTFYVSSYGHHDLMVRAEAALRAAATAPAKGDEPVAWRTLNDFGHWHVTTDAKLAATWIAIEKFAVESLYAHPSTTDADCEMAFIEACDEAECRYDNEALLKAIADLKARARPSSDRPASSHCWCGLHVTLKNRCDRCMERGVFARPASEQDGVREAIPTSVGSVGKP